MVSRTPIRSVSALSMVCLGFVFLAACGPIAHNRMESMEPEERLRFRENVRGLPPEQRRELRDDLSRFHSLSEDERESLRDRFHRLRSLAPDERDAVKQNAQRFRDLPPEQRERLRSAWRRLHALPPDERQQLLDQLD